MTNFNLFKLNKKHAQKYNGNLITYIDSNNLFNNKLELENYISFNKKIIKNFINNNPNHLLVQKWNNYYNQLNSLNLDEITYPLNKSLEQYFDDQGQPFLNPLQLP
jgi:hypothetical protein